MVEDIGALTVGEETLLKMWRVSLSSFKRVLQRHSHTRFEITVVERGAGSYTTPAGVLPMRAGDVFVFAGNEPHCITAVEDEGLRIVNLHFEPRYLFGRAGDTLSERHLDFCFAHAPDFSNRIPAERAEKLCSLHGEVAKELQEKRDEYALAVKSLLNLMLIALIRDHGYAAASCDGAGVRGVLRAMHYVDQHLCEKLTLADIAAQAGCSPTYFSALFRRYNTVSLWEYITTRRVEQAVRRICAPDFSETMLSVALGCGFNSTASFNRAFRQCTGMTPSEYRHAGNILLH